MKCDDKSLELLLEGDGTNDHSQVAQHLDSCDRCQARLVQLAADAEGWSETKYWLAQDSLLHRTSEGSSIDADVRPWQRRRRVSAWTDTMARSLLSPPSHPELLGRVGRYDVERLIGSGGMGVVFKAYDTELNRPVAVKLLAPYLAEHGAARKRFAREARAAAAVVDEHVVAIHNVESGEDPQQPPFLVMKYIAGGSLQERLDRDGPLGVCEILRIGMQTAKGLAAAHAQGLIHRDVKPSNILLDEGVERALLTDFGLARTEDDACLTRSGFHPGTPHYMSPEQVRGEAIDGRSDLFGLGCVLYALCTGHPPFRADSSYAVLRRITDDVARPIRELNSDIPDWLGQIVMKLLSKSPDNRFDSADDVAELLESCLAHVQDPTINLLPASVDAPDCGTGSRPPIAKYVAAAAFAFSLFVAGVIIVLELNKGTLKIESEANDVPIRIMQGDEVVDRMTLTRAGKFIRLAAGSYVVAIDGEFADLAVIGDTVTLQRGTNEVIRIEKTDGRKPEEIQDVKVFQQQEKIQQLQLDLELRKETGKLSPVDELVLQAIQHYREDDLAGAIKILEGIQRKFGDAERPSDIGTKRMLRVVSRMQENWSKAMNDRTIFRGAANPICRADLEVYFGREGGVDHLGAHRCTTCHDIQATQAIEASRSAGATIEEASDSVARPTNVDASLMHLQYREEARQTYQSFHKRISTYGKMDLANRPSSPKEVAAEVDRIVAEQHAISKADVRFRLHELNELRVVTREYRVYLDGESEHAGVEALTSDEPPKDAKSLAKSSLSGIDTFPDQRKLGLVVWWPKSGLETSDDHAFDIHLATKSRTEMTVTSERREGTNVAIVKFPSSFGAVNGLTEYWLSPTHGNRPIYAKKSCDGTSHLSALTIEQHTDWQNYNGVWFPKRIRFDFRYGESPSKHFILETLSAKFNDDVFPSAR